MKKLLLVLLFAPLVSFGQRLGYGYVRSDASSQIDYSKISKDFINDINDVVAKREAQARALGWSSAAEMDRARKANKRKIRADKKRRKRERKLRKKRYKRTKKLLRKN